MIRFDDMMIDVGGIEKAIPHPISFTTEKMESILKSLFKIAFAIKPKDGEKLKFKFRTHRIPPNTMGIVNINNFNINPYEAGTQLSKLLPKEYTYYSLHGSVIDQDTISTFFFLGTTPSYHNIVPSGAFKKKLFKIIKTDYTNESIKDQIEKEKNPYYQEFMKIICHIVLEVYPYDADNKKDIIQNRTDLTEKILEHIDKYIANYRILSGSIETYMDTLREICNIPYENNTELYNKTFYDVLNTQNNEDDAEKAIDIPNDIEIYINDELILS